MNIIKKYGVYIWFYVSLLGLLTGCGGQNSVNSSQGSVEDVSEEKLSDEVKWLVNCDASDSTNEHLQNMFQNYQILEDHILYTNVRSETEKNKKLYIIDRDGKNQKMVLDSVYRFVELNEKIYFSKWGEGEVRFQTIYEYDMKTQETVELEMDDVNICEFITVQKSKIVVASLDDIYEYNLADGTVEKVMSFLLSTPCKFFADDSWIILIAGGNIDLISMDKKRIKRIQERDALTDNIGVYKDGVLYIGQDGYTLGGINGITPRESSQNGLWKINLPDGEKEKILEKSPNGLFLLDGKVYDENLAEVLTIE